MAEKMDCKDTQIKIMAQKVHFLKTVPLGTVFSIGESTESDGYHSSKIKKKKLKLVNIFPYYMRFYDEIQKNYISYTFQEIAANGKIID